MKFVALLSGGKDSCYNALECVRHGHELVCLANLSPPAGVSDEADSFMYQSAGHTAIEAQAECFGKPLIRRELTGHAVNQALQYTPTETDEVEDLFLLLKEVKARFPEVQAVASGAILSNYQRTRVENVCRRLGLTSLAFLWRRRQSSLLQDMADSGTDAVVVKVASFGLEPSKHLGRSIASLQPFFEGLHKRCGFHVCGEGGEYETLTLDCPLFVRRLTRARETYGKFRIRQKKGERVTYWTKHRSQARSKRVFTNTGPEVEPCPFLGYTAESRGYEISWSFLDVRLAAPREHAQPRVLDETVKVIHSEDMFAPVGLLRVVRCHTEPKGQGPLPREVVFRGREDRVVAEGDAGGGGEEAEVEDRQGAPGVLRRETEGEEARRADVEDRDRSQPEGDAGRAAGGNTGREGSQEVRQEWGGNKAVGGSQAAAPVREVAVGSERRGRRHARFLNVLPHTHEASGGLVYLSGVKAPGALLPSNAEPFQRDVLGGSATSAAAARQMPWNSVFGGHLQVTAE